MIKSSDEIDAFRTKMILGVGKIDAQIREVSNKNIELFIDYVTNKLYIETRENLDNSQITFSIDKYFFDSFAYTLSTVESRTKLIAILGKFVSFDESISDDVVQAFSNVKSLYDDLTSIRTESGEYLIHLDDLSKKLEEFGISLEKRVCDYVFVKSVPSFESVLGKNLILSNK